MASSSAQSHERHRSLSTANKLRILILASEWGSSKGGLSTINRELAIHLAKHSGVHVTFFVPRCNDKEKSAAKAHNIDLLEARRIPGRDEMLWLSSPPHDLPIDIVVGHGEKLGPQAQAISMQRNCIWVQVVHTAPEELGMHKAYANPISSGERKHKTEVELCEIANFVVTVGPKLKQSFCSYLSSSKTDEDIFCFTPGVFNEFCEVSQVSERTGKFHVLLVGRGDAEDFSLKGFDIAAEAVAMSTDTHLIFVGAAEGQHEQIAQRFLDRNISRDSLTVRSFSNRESLKKIFCEVDLAIMPSRTEGFGLTGLEALSAGLPILVSKNSGLGQALSEIPFGSCSVVSSNEAVVWNAAIRNVMEKSREVRLEESKALRAYYERKYSWEKQIEQLVGKMNTLVCGGSHSLEKRGRNPQSGARGNQLSLGCGQGSTSKARLGGSRPATTPHDTRPVQRGGTTSSLTTGNEGRGFVPSGEAWQQSNENNTSFPTGSGFNQFPSGGLFGRNDDRNCIVCKCGLAATMFTVKKDNPNKGRHFYKCPNYNRNNGCEFFMWEGDYSGSTSSSLSHTTPLVPSSAINRNHTGFNSGQNLRCAGVSGTMDADTSNPFCYCTQPAVSRTVSKKGPNKGRPFYCCAKPRGQGCDFFEWGDTTGQSPSTVYRFKRNVSSGAASSGVSKKRKCGLCRQKGHTKRSCHKRRY